MLPVYVFIVILECTPTYTIKLYCKTAHSVTPGAAFHGSPLLPILITQGG